MAPRSKIAVPDVRRMRNLLSPVDTYVQTKPQYTSDAYDDKSKALAELKKALGVAQAENKEQEKIWQKKKDKEDKAAATRAAMLQKLGDGNLDAVSGERLHPEQSELFRDVYNEKLGNMHATTWQRSLLEKYEKEKGTILDIPSWLSGETQTYLNSLGENPSYIAGAYPIIQQVSANLISSHVKYKREVNHNNMKVALAQVWSNAYGDHIRDPAKAIEQNWKDLQIAIVYGTTGQDRVTLRNDFFTHAISSAESMDPSRGIPLLNALKQLGVNKQYVLKEQTPDGIRSTPTGLSSKELLAVENAIDNLEQEDRKQRDLDRDIRTNLISDNTAKAVAAFTEYRYQLEGKIPTLADKRAWITKYTKDNKLGVDNFDIGKWEKTVDARINNDRTVIEFQAKGPFISDAEKAIRTSTATGEALASFHRTGSNSQEDVEKEVAKALASYPQANPAVIRAALIRSLSGTSVHAQINKFQKSTDKLFKVFGYDDLGESTALGHTIAANFHSELFEIEKTLANTPGTTEISYGGKVYHTDKKSGILNLRDAILESVFKEAVEDSTHLQTILKGPNDPENKDDWASANNINKVSKKSMFEVLTRYGVGSPVVKEEKASDPAAELSDAAKVIYESKLKDQIAKNAGKPVLDKTKQMLALAAAKEAEKASANTPPKPSEGPLNIDSGINDLLKQYGSDSERKFKAKSKRGTKDQSLTAEQIDNFLDFLVKVGASGLYKSEDVFGGSHNRREKVDTKETEVPLNLETQKELFNRFFDLTRMGMRAGYFDALWNQVEERLLNTGMGNE